MPRKSPEERREYQREYREKNKDAINARWRKSYYKRKEKEEPKETYYSKNRKKLLEYAKNRYDDIKEKVTEYNKAYYQTNKEILNAKRALNRVIKNENKSNIDELIKNLELLKVEITNI